MGIVRFVELSVATLAAASIGVFIQRVMGWDEWSFYVVCLVFTIALHLIALRLTDYYTHTDTPLLDEVRGVALVPPFWVRFVGILAIGFALAIPFGFVAGMLR